MINIVNSIQYILVATILLGVTTRLTSKSLT